jgi:hypothetical protein
VSILEVQMLRQLLEVAWASRVEVMYCEMEFLRIYRGGEDEEVQSGSWEFFEGNEILV